MTERVARRSIPRSDALSFCPFSPTSGPVTDPPDGGSPSHTCDTWRRGTSARGQASICCSSHASMNASKSPSSTPWVLLVSKLVRLSLTRLYGWRTYDLIELPNPAVIGSPRSRRCSASTSARRRSRRRDFRIFIATSRFWVCDRSFWQVTTIPEGLWVNLTAEDVLLTCWPPAPDAR